MDPNRPPDSVSESELHALLDRRLLPHERAALETRLLNDAVAMATLKAWQAQREALRELHRPLLGEPLPPALLAAAQRLTSSQQQFDQWWRWGGMAASVALAFGVGWLSHGQWTSLRPQTSQVLAKARGTGQEFARQAAVAHVVYAPEVRHPVEVTAAQQEHLVQWLSKRLGRPLKVPNLSAQGYELVGGRLLPGETGARAQFMFQNESGERVTLYLGALNGDSSAAAKRETVFSFSTDGPIHDFYWVDQGFGYALAGRLPREGLMQLAQAVYQQLQP
ncbi:anti-sigma factor family protein [Polaromonas jejuensis]|uniref:Anti-sigma factor n=1 Tax=Polaromonas jejuensis TaxID=457502 RepID=A0ABW0QFX0_9BURK|nr:anti-sigma factor [Polaromonas jejuensis]